MYWFADNAQLVAGLLTAGLGGIVYWTDRGNVLSRPLALCLAAMRSRHVPRNASRASTNRCRCSR